MISGCLGGDRYIYSGFCISPCPHGFQAPVYIIVVVSFCPGHMYELSVTHAMERRRGKFRSSHPVLAFANLLNKPHSWRSLGAAILFDLLMGWDVGFEGKLTK